MSPTSTHNVHVSTSIKCNWWSKADLWQTFWVPKVPPLQARWKTVLPGNGDCNQQVVKLTDSVVE